MLFDNDFQVPLSVFAHGSESGNSTWLEPPERGPSAKLGHWRKAKKVWTSSMISQYHPPPPPTKTVGGGGRISREICRFFTFRAIIWRRGSNFPRKMQVLVSSSRHLAVGVLRSEVPPVFGLQ